MDVSAAILAGGKNLRMGRKNKALLQIEGQSFLERTVSRLKPLVGQVMIIGQDSNGYSGLGLPVFPDLRPGEGSLGGLLTALRHSDAPRTFCVACDMPFLQPAVVKYLLEAATGDWDVVIPRLPEGLEPLCAVYSAGLADRIEELLEVGEKRVRRVLEGSRTRYVEAHELRPLDPRLLTFINVNTPEDLRRVAALEEDARK